MTGLEKRAQNAQTTVPEIVTLTMAENPRGLKKVLGDSLDIDTPVQTGRGAALTALLERGRLQHILDALGLAPLVKKDNLS